MNTDCIFCKIVNKEVPASVLYEDETVISFLDINPVNEGHALIIPKDHYPYIIDTPDNIVSDMMVVAKKLMKGIKQSMGAKVVVLSIVGLDVAHFHIQLIPRFENDGLGGFWPQKKYESSEKMEEVAQKIRESIS